MADFGFKMGTFKWDRGGYIELQNSSAVQSLVSSEAQSVSSRANTQCSGGYAAKQVQGRFAKGYIVASDNADGYYDNLRNNTLKKVANS